MKNILFLFLLMPFVSSGQDIIVRADQLGAGARFRTMPKHPCQHYYVHQATPDIGRDSTITIRNESILQTLEYRETETVKVKADKPCICLYCRHKTKCY